MNNIFMIGQFLKEIEDKKEFNKKKYQQHNRICSQTTTD